MIDKSYEIINHFVNKSYNVAIQNYKMYNYDDTIDNTEIRGTSRE